MRSLLGIIAIVGGVFGSIISLVRNTSAGVMEGSNQYPVLIFASLILVFLGISSLVSRRKLILSLMFLVSLIALIFAIVGGRDLIWVFLVLMVVNFVGLLLRNRARGTYVRGDTSGQSIFGESGGRRAKIGASLMLISGVVGFFLYAIVAALDAWGTETARSGLSSALIIFSVLAVVVGIILVFRVLKVLVWIQTLVAVVGIVLITILGFMGVEVKTVLVLYIPVVMQLFGARLIK